MRKTWWTWSNVHVGPPLAASICKDARCHRMPHAAHSGQCTTFAYCVLHAEGPHRCGHEDLLRDSR